MLFFLTLPLSGIFARSWKKVIFCLIADLIKKTRVLKSKLNILTSTAIFMKLKKYLVLLDIFI